MLICFVQRIIRPVDFKLSVSVFLFDNIRLTVYFRYLMLGLWAILFFVTELFLLMIIDQWSIISLDLDCRISVSVGFPYRSLRDHWYYCFFLVLVLDFYFLSLDPFCGMLFVYWLYALRVFVFRLKKLLLYCIWCATLLFSASSIE